MDPCPFEKKLFSLLGHILLQLVNLFAKCNLLVIWVDLR